MSNAPARPRNPNRGYLAPNQKTNDRQPDWRGKMSVEGKDFLASGWFKEVTNDRGETARIVSIELTDPSTLPQRQGNGGQAARSPSPSQSATPAGSGSQDGVGGAGAFDDIFGGSGTF